MKSLKILVADDESNVRTLLRKMLEDWGHEIVEAADGSQALAMLESRSDLDVAILDWTMPEIDGREVCLRLREKQNPIYILLVTGRGVDHDVIDGLEAGANDYLTKPFAQDALRVRMLVATRFVEMRMALVSRVVELEGGILEKRDVDALLTGMMNCEPGVSDLLFVAGKHPQVEVYGKLKAPPIGNWDEILTPARIKQLASFLMGGNERLRSDYERCGSCDCSYGIAKLARLRVNIYKQNGSPAIVMRKLQAELPSLASLKLPPIFEEIIKEKNGIVLITGGTGTGKTTTLAAMLNELNQTADVHIVTLEDPIEFLHLQGKATFSQRQLGQDFSDFATGLRAAMRQAPKVILVGEIRDRETMEIAMTASETGHLVFSTLHTINASQTINRILGMFAKEDEPQVRQRLTETLRYVVSQRLITKIGGGRLMVSEIMGSSLRTREVISLGETDGRSLQEIIEVSAAKGWHSFDQSLLKAYGDSLITEETALLYCNSKSGLGQKIDKLKQSRGVKDESPINLRLSASPLGKTPGT